MAGQSGRSGTPLIRDLLREPYRFDFFQAVRLLEFLQPEREPVGSGLGPGREAVRFRASAALDFAASEIVGIAPPRGPGDVPEMTVSFLGLAGVNGPLPRPFSELLLERMARKDPAMRDFLDLFQHRLLALYYRVRKQSQVALHTSSPERSAVAERLFALTGLGTLGVRQRMAVPDRGLLRYAGILAQRPRSMHGLERILSDYFGAPVEGRGFVGRWIELEPEQQSVLGGGGEGGEGTVLGQNAVLGSRVWDQQGKFELVVGPLSLADFTAFLPGGERLPKLVGLTRFYIGPDLDFDIRLQLRPDEIPAARLGGSSLARLGWLSWLGSNTGTERGEIVIRDPERVAAQPAGAGVGGIRGSGQGPIPPQPSLAATPKNPIDAVG